MSLELKNGYPLLHIDYGSGTVRVEQKYKKLNDGKTHFIYIIFQQHVTILLTIFLVFPNL